jgi:hypothetical protein
MFRPRKMKVDYIHAYDEENETNRTEQNQQRSTGVFRYRFVE